MKQTTIRIMSIANAVSLALCAVTLLWVLFSGYTGWWKLIYNPALLIGYTAVALWSLRPGERSLKALAIVGLLRAAVAGWQFFHTLRYFVGVGIHNIEEFLQFPAALVFLIALGLYWIADQRERK